MHPAKSVHPNRVQDMRDRSNTVGSTQKCTTPDSRGSMDTPERTFSEKQLNEKLQSLQSQSSSTGNIFSRFRSPGKERPSNDEKPIVRNRSSTISIDSPRSSHGLATPVTLGENTTAIQEQLFASQLQNHVENLEDDPTQNRAISPSKAKGLLGRLHTHKKERPEGSFLRSRSHTISKPRGNQEPSMVERSTSPSKAKGIFGRFHTPKKERPQLTHQESSSDLPACRIHSPTPKNTPTVTIPGTPGEGTEPNNNVISTEMLNSKLKNLVLARAIVQGVLQNTDGVTFQERKSVILENASKTNEEWAFLRFNELVQEKVMNKDEDSAIKIIKEQFQLLAKGEMRKVQLSQIVMQWHPYFVSLAAEMPRFANKLIQQCPSYVFTDVLGSFIMECTEIEFPFQRSIHTLFRERSPSTNLATQFIRASLQDSLHALEKDIRQTLGKNVKQYIVDHRAIRNELRTKDPNFTKQDPQLQDVQVAEEMRKRAKPFWECAKKILSSIYAMRLPDSCKAFLIKRRESIQQFIAMKEPSVNAFEISFAAGEILFLRVLNPYLTKELPTQEELDIQVVMVKISQLVQALTNGQRVEEVAQNAPLINPLYDECRNRHLEFLKKCYS